MNAKLKKVKKVSVLVCCVSLLLGVAAGGGAAEGETSILERVTATTDWELGELIRQALEKSPELKDEAAQAALARRVTDAYVQIKLLDEQIKETNKKIESRRTTEVIRTELILARKELQANLDRQVAELREILKIVPEAKYERPVKVLNTWLALDVKGGDSVYLFTYSKPFYEPPPPYQGFTKSECRLDKIVSGQEAIAYVKNVIGTKDDLPLRIDIYRNRDGAELSEELKKQIDQIVEDAKLDMNPVEVYLVGGVTPDMFVEDIVLRQGTKAFWRNKPDHVLRPKEDFLRYITDNYLKKAPLFLPLKVYIEFDEESKDTATEMRGAINEAAGKLGVGQFVNIALLRDAFGQRKPVGELNSWLVLDVIGDDVVYVLQATKPYREWPTAYGPAKLMSQKEAVAYVKELMESKDEFPLRVDIYRNEPGSKPSEELYKQIVQLVKDAKLEAEAEVYLSGEDRSRGDRQPGDPDGLYHLFALRQGKWYFAHDDFSHVEKEGHDFTLPNLLHNIRNPGLLPYKLRIAFDHDSKDIAKDIVEGMQKAARELGIEQFVKVEAKATEDVNSWLALDVIRKNTVRVFRYSKPYRLPLQNRTECHPVGVKTPAEAIEYVREFVKSKEQLPLIVDVHRNQATIKTSEELYKQISQMVEDMKIEKDVAVYLHVSAGLWLGDMTLKQGKAYWRNAKDPWDPQFLISHMVEWDIARPGRCPFKLTIKFDQESKELATKMAEATKKAARELGVEQFVEIELKESEP